ncbi:MAG: hypothetical protein KDJ38_11470 [Gammaproteobacteria bacterium]|nr:hypothetical protein [Gammaproteobacteria bacterium]
MAADDKPQEKSASTVAPTTTPQTRATVKVTDKPVAAASTTDAKPKPATPAKKESAVPRVPKRKATRRMAVTKKTASKKPAKATGRSTPGVRQASRPQSQVAVPDLNSPEYPQHPERIWPD